MQSVHVRYFTNNLISISITSVNKSWLAVELRDRNWIRCSTYILRSGDRRHSHHSLGLWLSDFPAENASLPTNGEWKWATERKRTIEISAYYETFLLWFTSIRVQGIYPRIYLNCPINGKLNALWFKEHYVMLCFPICVSTVNHACR